MIKKICFFSTCFEIHKQVRAEYAEKYLPKEIELFLLTPPKHNHYKLKRMKVIEISGNKINFIFKLRKFCKENKMDILVNLGTSNESFGMLFATFGLKTRYIINEIGNMWGGLKLENKICKKLPSFVRILFLTIPFAFAKKIIYLSNDVCEQNKKRFFFIKRKMVQTHLEIDNKLFFPKNKIKVRKKLNLPAKKEIILFVGRIFYFKGSDILLEIIKNNPNKLFILVGGIMDENYKKQELKNILLIPSVNAGELVDYYNSADLFIFPSRVESYGLVQRESMLCETPVLVSDIPALRLTEYALKAKLTVEDMQKEIDKFFSMSKKERETLGKLGRKYIIKTNSYDVLKEEHKNLLLN